MNVEIRIIDLSLPEKIANDNDAVLYFGKKGKIPPEYVKEFMVEERLKEFDDDDTIIIEGTGDDYRFYNYCCINDGCEGDKKSHFVKKREKYALFPELCESCGQPEKLLGQKVNFVGKFTMSPPAERKQMLLKRSKEHHKKHIAENKREMLGGSLPGRFRKKKK